jgi:hypothetical protein
MSVTRVAGESQERLLRNFWSSGWVRHVSVISLLGELTKISDHFTFLHAVSPVGDFSEAARTDRPLSHQPRVTIDGVAFLLLDRGDIAAKFWSGCAVLLRRVVVHMIALRFVREINSEAFSGSSLDPIVIPRTAEILGSSCFSDCRSLSSVLIKSGSLLRRIESDAFSYSSLTSIIIPRRLR